MQPERVARPERRSRRWFRVGGRQIGAAQPIDGVAAQPLDERSMRALEILVSGLVLAVVGLLTLAQPAGRQSLGMVEVIGLGGVLFVAALVSLIR
jgi:hypothetical protein